MGDLMAKKDYNIPEITWMLLKMRDNCVQKEGDAYNDPERQEKYEALQAAADLINNPSRLVDTEPVRHGKWIYDLNNLYGCSECMARETMSRKRLKNYCPNCGAIMDKEKE